MKHFVYFLFLCKVALVMNLTPNYRAGMCKAVVDACQGKYGTETIFSVVEKTLMDFQEIESVKMELEDYFVEWIKGIKNKGKTELCRLLLGNCNLRVMHELCDATIKCCEIQVERWDHPVYHVVEKTITWLKERRKEKTFQGIYNWLQLVRNTDMRRLEVCDTMVSYCGQLFCSITKYICAARSLKGIRFFVNESVSVSRNVEVYTVINDFRTFRRVNNIERSYNKLQMEYLNDPFRFCQDAKKGPC